MITNLSIYVVIRTILEGQKMSRILLTQCIIKLHYIRVVHMKADEFCRESLTERLHNSSFVSMGSPPIAEIRISLIQFSRIVHDF